MSGDLVPDIALFDTSQQGPDNVTPRSPTEAAIRIASLLPEGFPTPKMTSAPTGMVSLEWTEGRKYGYVAIAPSLAMSVRATSPEQGTSIEVHTTSIDSVVSALTALAPNPK